VEGLSVDAIVFLEPIAGKKNVGWKTVIARVAIAIILCGR
jgi:hypothetical protein